MGLNQVDASRTQRWYNMFDDLQYVIFVVVVRVVEVYLF